MLAKKVAVAPIERLTEIRADGGMVGHGGSYAAAFRAVASGGLAPGAENAA